MTIIAMLAERSCSGTVKIIHLKSCCLNSIAMLLHYSQPPYNYAGSNMTYDIKLYVLFSSSKSSLLYLTE